MSKANEETNQVERVVMCNYFNCKKPATVKLIIAGGCFCDEHHLANIALFGCVFEVEAVNGGTQ